MVSVRLDARSNLASAGIKVGATRCSSHVMWRVAVVLGFLLGLLTCPAEQYPSLSPPALDPFPLFCQNITPFNIAPWKPKENVTLNIACGSRPALSVYRKAVRDYNKRSAEDQAQINYTVTLTNYNRTGVNAYIFGRAESRALRLLAEYDEEAAEALEAQVASGKASVDPTYLAAKAGTDGGPVVGPLLLFYRRSWWHKLQQPRSGTTPSGELPTWDTFAEWLDGHYDLNIDNNGTLVHGLCLDMMLGCKGWAILAAIYASMAQVSGPNNGLWFDLRSGAGMASRTGGSAMAKALQLYARLAQNNAASFTPNGSSISRSKISAAFDSQNISSLAWLKDSGDMGGDPGGGDNDDRWLGQCTSVNPLFAAGSCLFTIDWVSAALTLNAEMAHEVHGDIGACILPGSSTFQEVDNLSRPQSTCTTASCPFADVMEQALPTPYPLPHEDPSAPVFGEFSTPPPMYSNAPSPPSAAVTSPPTPLYGGIDPVSDRGFGLPPTDVPRREILGGAGGNNGGGDVVTLYSSGGSDSPALAQSPNPLVVNRAPLIGEIINNWLPQCQSAELEAQLNILIEEVGKELGLKYTLLDVAASVDNIMSTTTTLKGSGDGADGTRCDGEGQPANVSILRSSNDLLSRDRLVDILSADETSTAAAARAYLGITLEDASQIVKACKAAMKHPNRAYDYMVPFSWRYRAALDETALAALRMVKAGQVPPPNASVWAELAVALANSSNIITTRDFPYPAILRAIYLAPIAELSDGVLVKSVDRSPILAIALPVALSAGSALLFMVVAGFIVLRCTRSRRRNALRAPRAGQSTTLVMTDVQNSTLLWEVLPEGVMDLCLGVHHRIMRKQIEANKGYEAFTEGDAFAVAFHTPEHALAFALDVQVDLLAAEWPASLLDHPDGCEVWVQHMTAPKPSPASSSLLQQASLLPQTSLAHVPPPAAAASVPMLVPGLGLPSTATAAPSPSLLTLSPSLANALAQGPSAGGMPAGASAGCGHDGTRTHVSAPAGLSEGEEQEEEEDEEEEDGENGEENGEGDEGGDEEDGLARGPATTATTGHSHSAAEGRFGGGAAASVGIMLNQGPAEPMPHPDAGGTVVTAPSAALLPPSPERANSDGSAVATTTTTTTTTASTGTAAPPLPYGTARPDAWSSTGPPAVKAGGLAFAKPAKLLDLRLEVLRSAVTGRHVTGGGSGNCNGARDGAALRTDAAEAVAAPPERATGEQCNGLTVGRSNATKLEAAAGTGAGVGAVGTAGLAAKHGRVRQRSSRRAGPAHHLTGAPTSQDATARAAAAAATVVAGGRSNSTLQSPEAPGGCGGGCGGWIEQDLDSAIEDFFQQMDWRRLVTWDTHGALSHHRKPPAAGPSNGSGGATPRASLVQRERSIFASIAAAAVGNNNLGRTVSHKHGRPPALLTSLSYSRASSPATPTDTMGQPAKSYVGDRYGSNAGSDEQGATSGYSGGSGGGAAARTTSGRQALWRGPFTYVSSSLGPASVPRPSASPGSATAAAPPGLATPSSPAAPPVTPSGTGTAGQSGGAAANISLGHFQGAFSRLGFIRGLTCSSRKLMQPNQAPDASHVPQPAAAGGAGGGAAAPTATVVGGTAPEDVEARGPVASAAKDAVAPPGPATTVNATTLTTTTNTTATLWRTSLEAPAAAAELGLAPAPRKSLHTWFQPQTETTPGVGGPGAGGPAGGAAAATAASTGGAYSTRASKGGVDSRFLINLLGPGRGEPVFDALWRDVNGAASAVAGSGGGGGGEGFRQDMYGAAAAIFHSWGSVLAGMTVQAVLRRLYVRLDVTDGGVLVPVAEVEAETETTVAAASVAMVKGAALPPVVAAGGPLLMQQSVLQPSGVGFTEKTGGAPPERHLVFRGLRVRMGMTSNATEAEVVTTFHWRTSTVTYTGEFLATCRDVSDVAMGGMVLLSDSAFREYSRGRKEAQRQDVMLIHLGDHVLKPAEHEPVADPDTDSGPPSVPLYAAVSPSLAARLALLPSMVRNTRPLSPGCLAAPAGSVAAVFLNVVGIATLREWERLTEQLARREISDTSADMAVTTAAATAHFAADPSKAGGGGSGRKPGVVTAALALFRRVMRESVAALGGYVVASSADDGHWVLVFGGPEAAVRWGLDVLRAMLEAEWPAGLLDHELTEEVWKGGVLVKRGLRLSIGVDYGGVMVRLVPRSGRLDYVGRPMNRAARIVTKAKAASMLVSGAVWDAVRPSLGPSVAATSLGPQQLKGIKEPLELWAVAERGEPVAGIGLEVAAKS